MQTVDLPATTSRSTSTSTKRSAPAAAPAPASAEQAAPAAPASLKAQIAALPDLDARTLRAIHPLLCRPFRQRFVELKPGKVLQGKARALAFAFVDPRQYQSRLDLLAGAEGWQVEYIPVSERALRCRLTILGVTKEDVGECDAGDTNQATSSAMQAFKRACAAFGLGRYLYSLPQLFADYDEERKRFIDPAKVVADMYSMAGVEEQAQQVQS